MIRNTGSLGIVVELENIEASGAERAHGNLRELLRQIEAMARGGNGPAGPIHFLVIYDSEVFSASDAQGFIAGTGLGDSPLVAAEAHGVPGIHYYEHKNVGARLLQTDLILFMDSDILIEPEWLANMIAPFEDEAVNFVSGQTVIETPRFLDKIYALTVPGFPLVEPGARGLQVTSLISANAFAFRRSKLDGALFPSINAYRGHCGIAAQELIRNGETLYRQMGARAMHPSQDSLADYFSRAFAEGCDAIVLSRHNNRPTLRGKVNRSLAGSILRLGQGIWGLVRRSITRFDRVDLPAVGIPVVIVVGSAYFAVRFLGEILTLLSTPLAMRLSIAKQTH